MNTGVLLLGYGLAGIGTLVNAPAWLRLMIDRLRAPDRESMFFDVYSMMRLGLTLISFSLLVPYALRTTEMLAGKLPPAPAIYVLSIYGLAIGEACFIRGTWIQGQHAPSMFWAVGCCLWVAFCFWRGFA